MPTVANGDITDGGATYTLRLRHDVLWHDGQPFTAADVKFSFETALLVHHGRTRNMASALASRDPVAQVASIDVVDSHTVRFRFAEPYAPLLQQLNVTEAAMLPAHLYSGNPTLAQLNANRVGKGPMRFDSATLTEVRVVRNPAYFRAPLPDLEEIVMRPLIDDTARFQALVTGAVDFVWGRARPVRRDAGGQSGLPDRGHAVAGRRGQLDRPADLQPHRERRPARPEMGGPDPNGTPDPPTRSSVAWTRRAAAPRCAGRSSMRSTATRT